MDAYYNLSEFETIMAEINAAAEFEDHCNRRPRATKHDTTAFYNFKRKRGEEAVRFRIYSTWNWDDAKQLLEEYPCLRDFGFEVETIQLKFETRDASYIRLRSIEELRLLRKAVGQPLIIGSGDENNIEIYDSYRE